MHQVSPESPLIFGFSMHNCCACSGKWETLVAQCDGTSEEVDALLQYGATFLCNLKGDYYVRSVRLLRTVNLTDEGRARARAIRSSFRE
jgi:hypothetical protein